MITYYIGAGASANALPVVDQIPSHMYTMAQNSKLYKLFLEEGGSPGLKFNPEYHKKPSDKKEQLEDFIENLLWLSAEGSNHVSIDTFAKKLWVRKEYPLLKRLKITLSCFFILSQIEKWDKRYDAFFATIINKDPFDLPSHLKIISWNYDYQFERAYSEFTGINDLRGNQNKLNIISKHDEGRANINQFSLTKLNGTTGFYSPTRSTKNLLDYFSTEFNTVVEEVLRKYYKVLYEDESTVCALSFAWEPEATREISNSEVSNIVNVAIENSIKSEILIVIGYSFPNFNRDVDRAIIRSMDKLKKVYIQAPPNDVENIKIRFRSILPDFDEKEIVLWPDCGQFLIPPEF